MRSNSGRFILFAAVFVFLLFSISQIVIAAPGDLDTTFGSGGTATDFVNNVTIYKVVLQPDGKVIVVGKRRLAIQFGQPAKDYLFVRRYTSTGAFDTSYPGFMQGVGFEAEVQPDGKLVVVGQAPNTVTFPLTGATQNVTSPIVWRFNANGTLDTSFGTNGSRFFNVHSYGNFHVDIFNTYIVVGYASRHVFLASGTTYRVTRLSQEGTVNYNLTLPFTYNSTWKDFSMKVDPATGDILAASGAALRRYTIEASAVAGFGNNGQATIPNCFSTPGLPFTVKDIEIQPDGAILAFRAYDAYQAVNISRQTMNGDADPAVCLDLSVPPAIGNDLLLQPDGRFFFYAGAFAKGLRYFPDGSSATHVLNMTPYAPVIQPDQKLVTAWATSSSVQLKRQVLD